MPDTPTPGRRSTALLPLNWRETLAVLVAAHPRLSRAQLANLFREKTGAEIARSTIGRIKHGLSRPGSLGDTDYRMSGPQRELLASLVRDSEPDCNRTEIADEFARITGRPISRDAVSKFVLGRLGGQKRSGGRRKGVADSAVAARIEAAHERKLATAKVDRTPRVGRTGRIAHEEMLS
jgi:hypothetical protein